MHKGEDWGVSYNFEHSFVLESEGAFLISILCALLNLKFQTSDVKLLESFLIL